MLSNASIAVLQNVLRPETVIALESVPFTLRAEALPGVLSWSWSIDDVPFAGDNPDEEMIDVKSCMRITPDTEERMLVLANHLIVGGLAYDQHSQNGNPCEEGAANGNIYHGSIRRGDDEERRNFYEALGLDGDGNKNLSCQAVRDRLVKRVMKGVGDDLSVFSRLIHRLRATGREVSKASLEKVVEYAINQEGGEYALDYLVDALYGVKYFNRLDGNLQDAFEGLADLFSASEMEKCWDEACAAGEVGNPYAVELDIYEHGGVAYSVSGTGMQCRWDTSRSGAVWVPDEDALDNIRSSVLSELGIGQVKWFGACGSKTDPTHARYSLDSENWIGEGMGWKWREAQNQMIEASAAKIDQKKFRSLMQARAVEYCRGVLDEYNNWANGYVYGAICYVIDRLTGEVIDDHESECWGILGSEAAESELEAVMLAAALQLGCVLH